MSSRKKPVDASKTIKPKKKQPAATRSLKETETQRLIHELQVHQIELEMHNEELVQARADVEEAYRQYTDLYDFAPVGYFTLARDGTIRETNLAGANLLGVERVKLINRRLGLFVSEESRPALGDFLEKLLTGQGKETSELAFLKNGNELIWASIEATCFEGGLESRAAIMDITPRKRINSLLQARVRISEFAEAHTLDELLQKTLDEAEILTGSTIGFSHFLEADQKTLRLQMWSTNTVKNMCTAEGKDSHYPVDQAGVWADCVNTHGPIIHNDYPNLPASRRKGLPEGHAPVQREIVVPVLRNNLIVMIMGVGNKAADYSDNDVEVLSQLANLTWDIVQRKQAEEALRESEWRNRVVSELTTDYIFIVDVDPAGLLKLRWASDNMFRETGRTLEEATVFESWASIIHPEDLDRFFGFIKQTLSTAESGEFECRTFTKQGKVRWIRLFAQPQVGEGNKITIIIGAVQDITERRQAEEALRKSEEKYRLLIENMNSGVFQSTLTGTFLQLNNMVAEMAGYRNVEELMLQPADVLYADIADRQRIKDLLMLHGEVSNIELQSVKKDGTRYWISMNAVIQRDQDGTPDKILGIVNDITERKLAEDALRESQELFSLYMRHSPIYAFIKESTPAESKVVQASDNFLQMIGIAGREMIGKTMQELYPPEAAAKYTADDWAVVSKGEVLKQDEDLNGRHFTTIKFPITLGDKTLLAGYTIDITERKEAEVELEYIKAGLEAANRQLEEANLQLKDALVREQQLAHTDVLTGISNRRYLYEQAEHEYEIAVRYQKPLSVIMFDLDHFKDVNDTFGHAAGDQILQQVTQVACEELRSTDVIGRYGGEEFVIVLPMTNAQQAFQLAERIRAGVEALRVPTKKGDASVTLSIGIVETLNSTPNGSVENMIRRADKAMYDAKQAGRNQTKIGE